MSTINAESLKERIAMQELGNQLRPDDICPVTAQLVCDLIDDETDICQKNNGYSED